jgi:hypothetical protein
MIPPTTVLLSLLAFFLLRRPAENQEKSHEEESADDDDDDKENETEGDVKPSSIKKARIMLRGITTPVESNTHTMGYHVHQQWMPTYALAMWKDDKLRKRVTVCVSFDGGVNLEDDVTLRVSEDGSKLEIKARVVKRLNDVDTLHEYHRQKWKDSLPPFHPKIIAFQEFFKALKKTEDEFIYNEAVIFLPFPVQGAFVEEIRLKDQYTCLSVYVEMLAIEEDIFSSKSKSKIESMA